MDGEQPCSRQARTWAQNMSSGARASHERVVPTVMKKGVDVARGAAEVLTWSLCRASKMKTNPPEKDEGSLAAPLKVQVHEGTQTYCCILQWIATD